MWAAEEGLKVTDAQTHRQRERKTKTGGRTLEKEKVINNFYETNKKSFKRGDGKEAVKKFMTFVNVLVMSP